MQVFGRQGVCETCGSCWYLDAAMTSLQQEQEVKSQSKPMRGLPLLLRLSWMAIGNVALFLCTALVAKGTAPEVMDTAFFVVVVGLILVRYVDIVRFKGQTSEGKPATLSHSRRYAVMLGGHFGRRVGARANCLFL